MIGCTCAVCRSADPRDRRFRTSVWLQTPDETSILIDTATDLRSQALAFGIDRVDAVLYTHSHADHVLGFDDLRCFNVLSKRPIRAFGDEATLTDLKRMFSYAFEADAPAGGGVPHIVLTPIDGPFDLGGVRCHPVPILHGPRPILGYRLGAFAYLTDCSGIPETSFPGLRDLDVLVLSALRHRPHPTHFTLAAAVDAARRVGARQTFFTHMCHDLGHAGTNATLPAGMALAFDGLTLEVDA